MVVVPAGSFTMGSPASEAGRYDNEGPQHPVTIGRSFAAGKFEVTRAEFAAFVREAGYQSGSSCWIDPGGGKRADTAGKGWRDPGYSQTDRDPVVCVSWDDAQAYVAWLGQTTGKSYRLLSEAEWEYAARGGTGTSRYWGDSPSAACGYANVYDLTGKRMLGYDWENHDCDDGEAHTSPVGHYRPNGFGLYDMIGNVWERVEDCWHVTYGGAPSDGSAWSGGDCSKRVLRGGSWGNLPRLARAAYRNWSDSEDPYNNDGFRVARTL
jgi:formylglycine-generating enzyme required for sulfatase activity